MTEKDLLRKVTATFETLGIPYFITGGMASIVYGEPRYTSDIDVVADIPKTAISGFLVQFPVPEYYLSEQAVREAIATRFQFNILHPTSGLKVDVMIPSASEHDRLRMQRMVRLSIDSETNAWFASPEDVILKKLVYFQIGGSEKHLRDIASMILVMGEKIDRAYIETWASTLGVMAEWQLVCDRLREQTG